MVTQLEAVIADDRLKFHKDVREGTFYPLDVYKAKGFNVEHIEKNCADVEDHPVLGKTYRVALHTVSEGEVRESVRKQLMELKGRGGKKRKALAAAVDTAQSSGSKQSCGSGGHRKKSKKARSSSSSSSSSTSSSSRMPAPKLTKEELIQQREASKAKLQKDCSITCRPRPAVFTAF